MVQTTKKLVLLKQCFSVIVLKHQEDENKYVEVRRVSTNAEYSSGIIMDFTVFVGHTLLYLTERGDLVIQDYETGEVVGSTKIAMPNGYTTTGFSLCKQKQFLVV